MKKENTPKKQQHPPNNNNNKTQNSLNSPGKIYWHSHKARTWIKFILLFRNVRGHSTLFLRSFHNTAFEMIWEHFLIHSG